VMRVGPRSLRVRFLAGFFLTAFSRYVRFWAVHLLGTASVSRQSASAVLMPPATRSRSGAGFRCPASAPSVSPN